MLFRSIHIDKNGVCWPNTMTVHKGASIVNTKYRFISSWNKMQNYA